MQADGECKRRMGRLADSLSGGRQSVITIRVLALIALIAAVVIVALPVHDSWLLWCYVGVLGLCGGAIGLWAEAEWRERQRVNSERHEASES